ncbi:unnamed protein product [Pleuronectes platessa]|uniref:Uncharacterized protein n=1 Tax=Pleuronectes platessa TaxID=8262 RepID=A0A9N7UUY2_PLEPL|nr:unnamed protein product [Pleuronectes platessa]
MGFNKMATGRKQKRRRNLEEVLKDHGVHLMSQTVFSTFIVAHGAPVEKAIDGLSISLWTHTILLHREGVCCAPCSIGELCTQLCRFTQGDRGGQDAAYSSIQLTSGPRRRTDEEGRWCLWQGVWLASSLQQTRHTCNHSPIIHSIKAWSRLHYSAR